MPGHQIGLGAAWLKLMESKELHFRYLEISESLVITRLLDTSGQWFWHILTLSIHLNSTIRESKMFWIWSYVYFLNMLHDFLLMRNIKLSSTYKAQISVNEDDLFWTHAFRLIICRSVDHIEMDMALYSCFEILVKKVAICIVSLFAGALNMVLANELGNRLKLSPLESWPSNQKIQDWSCLKVWCLRIPRDRYSITGP